MVSKEKSSQLMREGKKQGKALGRGVPLSFSSHAEFIKLWESIEY